MPKLNGVKQYNTAIYPVHASQTSGLLRRAEPALNPEQLVSRFLKGVPLRFPNGDVFSTDDIKDRINLATNSAEILINRPIFTEVFKEKFAFDHSLYNSYIHIKTNQGPITTLEYLAIIAADGSNIFQLPPEWIESANFSKNLINVIPLLAAYGVNQVSGAVGNAGIAFLTVLGGLTFVPAYWEVGYTAGLSNTEGQVPIIVNELIGCIAAIDILSELAPAFYINSRSQSQDNISQSSTGPGVNRFVTRIAELEKKKAELVRKIKNTFASSITVSNI